jgi:hypothetical protein
MGGLERRDGLLSRKRGEFIKEFIYAVSSFEVVEEVP